LFVCFLQADDGDDHEKLSVQGSGDPLSPSRSSNELETVASQVHIIACLQLYFGVDFMSPGCAISHLYRYRCASNHRAPAAHISNPRVTNLRSELLLGVFCSPVYVTGPDT
jgi:hypothetical protein